jgi:signal transduction histidine kinase/CheY-like chemotaxis protein
MHNREVNANIYETLFQQSPVCMWEEDFSASKSIIDGILESGVSDLDAHFAAHPEDLVRIAAVIRIVDANAAGMNLFKAKTRQEFIDNYPSFFHEDTTPDFINFIKDVAAGRTQSAAGLEVAVQTLARERRDIILSWSAEAGRDDYSRIWFYAVDITEKKQADQELRRYREQLEALVAERTRALQETHEQLLHAQKMEAVGTLAGGIAHDFNNILATISGAAELLLRSTQHDAPQAHKLQRILNSSLRAKDLTMKLLTFARKEKLNTVRLCPNTAVREVMDMLQSTASKKITLSTHLDPALLYVEADANQLIQALLNICLNACDAMPGGGELSVHTRNTELFPDQARVLGTQPGAFCEITVSDTGQGMDQATAGKIFEPFFTTKERGKGSGLGLSVSHGIITAHHGTLSVRSEPGNGASFRILLPAVPKPDVQPGPGQTSHTARTQGTLLLVDDDEAFLDTVGELLTFEGFDVLSACFGEQALQIFEAERERIKLVLLDMIMPGMDGPEIFRALQSLNPDVPVALCSGFSVEGDASALLDQGAIAYLQKPFAAAELLALCSRAMLR